VKPKKPESWTWIESVGALGRYGKWHTSTRQYMAPIMDVLKDMCAEMKRVEKRGPDTIIIPPWLEDIMRKIKRDEKAIRLFPELVLMVDTFCACIETRVMPSHGSPCHRKARDLVEQSAIAPKRKRRRLPKVVTP
jgi:hypothetical protein